MNGLSFSVTVVPHDQVAHIQVDVPFFFGRHVCVDLFLFFLRLYFYAVRSGTQSAEFFFVFDCVTLQLGEGGTTADWNVDVRHGPLFLDVLYLVLFHYLLCVVVVGAKRKKALRERPLSHASSAPLPKTR